MKRVRHKGARAGFVRIIRARDLDQLGIKHHRGEDLVFSQDNNFEIVMSNQLSDSLVERLPDEFVAFDTDEADEADPVPDPMTSLASSSEESSEDDPDSSEQSANDDEQSSTRKGSKNK